MPILYGSLRMRLVFVGLLVSLLLLTIFLIVFLKSVTHDDTPVAPTQPTVQYKTPIIEPGLVTTGLQAPLGVVATPDKSDKRLFVIEQGGLIRTLNGQRQLEAEPFLDLTQKIKRTDEMGLLGLVFHPSFAKNHYAYINYNDKDMNTVIARFTVAADGRKIDPASEKPLLKYKQPYQNHNGGDMAFGPDGYLYIASGDGGWAGDPHDNGQNKDSYLGKILRIDVNKGDPYAIPPSNPFVSQPGVKPEIWAYGLRNPWRISFDRQTGDLYIADVGEKTTEELNFQKASSKGGENYGWRCYEGNKSYNLAKCGAPNQYVGPVLEYAHENKHCSITGGYVYRGQKNPALKGKYLVGDFCTGDIYYTSLGSNWKTTVALKTPFGITSFGQDGQGELYLTDAKSGSLYSLRDVAN